MFSCVLKSRITEPPSPKSQCPPQSSTYSNLSRTQIASRRLRNDRPCGTPESTKYARCARSFRQHHGQRISHAVVMTDALNVHEGTLKLKKLALQRRAA